MADVDIEALGLLDGLEGEAREDRVQLIAWLPGPEVPIPMTPGVITPPDPASTG